MRSRLNLKRKMKVIFGYCKNKNDIASFKATNGHCVIEKINFVKKELLSVSMTMKCSYE